MQEAAEVISVGGAYQNYIMQYKDGSPNITALRKLKELSEFVRERKSFCFHTAPIHQTALLLSTYDRHKESKTLYSRNGYEKILGMSTLLCDIGQSLEIICEHTLEKNRDEYKTIVIPELYQGLEQKTVKSLLTYAEKGGKLVLIGKKTCSVFSDAGAPFLIQAYSEFIETSWEILDDGHGSAMNEMYKPYHFTMDGTSYGTMFSPCGIVASCGVAKAFLAEEMQQTKEPLAVTIPYRKGSITALGFDIGSQYLNGKQYLHKILMKQLMDSLYIPMVRIESSCGYLEILARKSDETILIQLINAGGSHRDLTCSTEDDLPPVLDIQLSIDLPTPPNELILHPEEKTLPFEYRNGRAYVAIERLDIHSVLEVLNATKE